MKHPELKWNPATQEWVCVVCGRTSDHVNKRDAERELSQFDCQPEPPSTATT